MAAHALLSASSAKRWLACTPSARLTADMEDVTSEFALEGTLAHELCEAKVNHWLGRISDDEFQHIHGNIRLNDLYKNEMEYCSDEYLYFLREQLSEDMEDVYITLEQRVDYSEAAPEGFGTSDCIIVGNKRLTIVDYKHGKGVAVSATDNEQLKLYAFGAFRRYAMYYAIETIRLAVVQPRNGGVSTFDLSLEELLKWITVYVEPRAKLAWNGEGEYVCGEHCKFCKAAGCCRARAEHADVQVPDVKSIPLLSFEEAGDYLERLSDTVQFVKKLETYVKEGLNSGHAVKGWKLVEGRKVRSWTDQIGAFSVFKENGIDDAFLFDKKPVTPAALERAIGKDMYNSVVSSHVRTVSGNAVLAKESDKRSGIISSAALDFKDFM